MMATLNPALVLSLEEFKTLWESLMMEPNNNKVETSAAFRKANRLIGKEDVTGSTTQQGQAPYGRTLPCVTDIIFQVLRLQEDDIYLDLGHGLGNTAFQAVLCRGCQARGIELVKHRFHASQELATKIAAKLGNNQQREQFQAKVELRHGCFADPALNSWLKQANKVYINNWHDTFDEVVDTDPDGRTYTLNDYVAGLFACLAKGSLMVTLSEIDMGCLSLEDANDWREEQGLEPSPHASFYEVVQLRGLGDATTWESFYHQSSNFATNNNPHQPAHLFVYRRV